MQIVNRGLIGLALLLSLGCDSAEPTSTKDATFQDTVATGTQPDSQSLGDGLGGGDGAVSNDIAQAGLNPFGAIDEPCESLSKMVLADTASFTINEFQFDGSPFNPDELSAGGNTLFTSANAGGSSKCSEVFSLELWRICAGAELHQGETQIVYSQQGAMTDYTVKIQDQVIGVSVTRAYKGPTNLDYAVADAKTLLTKKLNGINESTANVAPESAWSKQVLHIWTLHKEWADVVQTSWTQLDKALTANTTVVVTVESGSEFVVTDTCDD